METNVHENFKAPCCLRNKSIPSWIELLAQAIYTCFRTRQIWKKKTNLSFFVHPLIGTVALAWLSGLRVPKTPRAMPAGMFTPLAGPPKPERSKSRVQTKISPMYLQAWGSGLKLINLSRKNMCYSTRTSKDNPPARRLSSNVSNPITAINEPMRSKWFCPSTNHEGEILPWFYAKVKKKNLPTSNHCSAICPINIYVLVEVNGS